MFGKCKYICGTLPGSNVPDAIIFPSTITHADMAQWTGMTVLGAGFVSIDTSEYGVKVQVSPYGRSESLDIDSRPQDEKFIKRSLNLED